MMMQPAAAANLSWEWAGSNRKNRQKIRPGLDWPEAKEKKMKDTGDDCLSSARFWKPGSMAFKSGWSISARPLFEAERTESFIHAAADYDSKKKTGNSSRIPEISCILKSRKPDSRFPEVTFPFFFSLLTIMIKARIRHPGFYLPAWIGILNRNPESESRKGRSRKTARTRLWLDAGFFSRLCLRRRRKKRIVLE